MAAKLTPAELAELNGTTLTPAELGELNGSSPGPFADSYHAAKPDFVPGSVPHLPPQAALPAPPESTSQGHALVNGVVRGATLDFDDEAKGILDAVGQYGGDESGVLDIPAPKAGGIEGVYRKGRDERRADKAQTQKDWPLTTVGGQIAGGLAVPLGPGSGFVANTAKAAVAGGLQAAGASEEETAGGVAKDAALGAGIGGAIGAGGELAKAGVKAIGNKLVGDLPRALRNEATEGASKAAERSLVKAGDNATNEIIYGENGDALRKAMRGPAEEGSKTVKAFVARVGDENRAAYDAFAKSGRDTVDATALMVKLENARQAATGEKSAAIGAFQKKILAEQSKPGGLTLQRLRDLTTEAQTAGEKTASESTKASVKHVERLASQSMDEALTAASKGSKELQAAAQTIRDNNKRMNGLLALKKTVDSKVSKEATAPSALMSIAKKAALPVAFGMAGGGGGLMHGDDWEGALEHAAMAGAAGVGIPAAGKFLQNRGTDVALKLARNPQAADAVARLSRAFGRVGARVAASGARTGAGDLAP